MKAEILNPCGYCYGVENAINMAINIRKDNPNKNIFVLGMLVHNEFVCDYLAKNGIQTINAEPKDYANELAKLTEGDIVIFTAHGHDESLNEIAKDHGLISYDAICPMVKKNLSLIKKALNENKTVLYIGQENHPEAIAATAISNDVLLIPNKLLKHNQISTNKDIFVINQTTLNYQDILKTHESIKQLYGNVTIANEVCSATRLRQQSIDELDESYDALLVVGSKKSSNTNKLYDIAIKKHPNVETYRIETLKDIDLAKLKAKKKVAITGGTSTPLKVLQLICDYLNNN